MTRAEPHIKDFIRRVINHTHVLDMKQKLRFPILAELEKIALYDQTGLSSKENLYESLSASDSELDSLSEDCKSESQIQYGGDKRLENKFKIKR